MSGEREPILVGAHYDRIGRGAFIFKGALDERTAAGVHIVAPAECCLYSWRLGRKKKGSLVLNQWRATDTPNKFGVFVTLAGAYEKTDIMEDPGFTSQFLSMPSTGSPSRWVYESAISP